MVSRSRYVRRPPSRRAAAHPVPGAVPRAASARQPVGQPAAGIRVRVSAASARLDDRQAGVPARASAGPSQTSRPCSAGPAGPVAPERSGGADLAGIASCRAQRPARSRRPSGAPKVRRASAGSWGRRRARLRPKSPPDSQRARFPRRARWNIEQFRAITSVRARPGRPSPPRDPPPARRPAPSHRGASCPVMPSPPSSRARPACAGSRRAGADLHQLGVAEAAATGDIGQEPGAAHRLHRLVRTFIASREA